MNDSTDKSKKYMNAKVNQGFITKRADAHRTIGTSCYSHCSYIHLCSSSEFDDIKTAALGALIPSLVDPPNSPPDLQ